VLTLAAQALMSVVSHSRFIHGLPALAAAGLVPAGESTYDVPQAYAAWEATCKDTYLRPPAPQPMLEASTGSARPLDRQQVPQDRGRDKQQQVLTGASPPAAQGGNGVAAHAAAAVDGKRFAALMHAQQDAVANDVAAGRRPDVAALLPPEPECEWQRHTAPLPEDPRYVVTYYHNVVTGESTYEPPAEYVAWEASYRGYLGESQGQNLDVRFAAGRGIRAPAGRR
jgi:hypothetical protein